MKTLVCLMLLCLAVGAYCDKTVDCDGTSFAEYIGAKCDETITLLEDAENPLEEDVAFTCNECCTRAVEYYTACGGGNATEVTTGCVAAAVFFPSVEGCAGPSGSASGAALLGAIAVPVVLMIAKLAYLLSV